MPRGKSINTPGDLFEREPYTYILDLAEERWREGVSPEAPQAEEDEDWTFSPKEARERLKNEGYDCSKTSVQNNLKTLKDYGLIDKVARGQYRLDPVSAGQYGLWKAQERFGDPELEAYKRLLGLCTAPNREACRADVPHQHAVHVEAYLASPDQSRDILRELYMREGVREILWKAAKDLHELLSDRLGVYGREVPEVDLLLRFGRDWLSPLAPEKPEWDDGGPYPVARADERDSSQTTEER